MKSGQRHFGGSDQVEVVGVDAVDLVGMRTEEAGARHHLRPHQHRRDDERETVVRRDAYGELQQAELQQRPRTGQEVEPRARHLRAALHVDQTERLPEFQVILRVLDGSRFADGLEHREVVLAAGRDAVDDHVGDRHVRCGERLFGPGLLGLGGLDLLGECLGLFQHGRPLVGRCLCYLLADALLLGAQVVRGRHRGPSRSVGFEERTDQPRVFATGTLRCAHQVRVFTQQLEVDHGSNPTFDRRPRRH